MNKKGQLTVFMFILLVACFLVAIFLFVGGVVVIKTNNALSQDIDLGQVNLATLNDETFGVFSTTFLNNADWWGLCVIFGMIIGLFLSAYFLRNKFPKAGIIFDIFIILTAFFISLYISSSYSTLLDALNSAGETFLEDYAAKTSMFILNLHIFVTIIGVIMMVLFHSTIPRRTEENIQQGGFLQGVQ